MKESSKPITDSIVVFEDAHKIITFYPFISSNCMALAIFSPRFTEMLTDGCETPSFFDSSVVLIPNLFTAKSTLNYAP